MTLKRKTALLALLIFAALPANSLSADEAPKRAPGPKRRFTIPFDFPQFVLGPLSIRAFNTLFYWKPI